MFIVVCRGLPQIIDKAHSGRKAPLVLREAFDQVTTFATEEEAHTVIGRTLCHNLSKTTAGRATPMQFDFQVVSLVSWSAGS